MSTPSRTYVRSPSSTSCTPSAPASISAAAAASRAASSVTTTCTGSQRAPAAAMPESGTECLFHLGPEALLARCGRHRLECGELLDERFLLASDRLRRPQLDAH